MYVSGYQVQTTVIVVCAIATVIATIFVVRALRNGRPLRSALVRAGLMWTAIAITGVSLEPDSGRDSAGTCSLVLDLDLRFALDQRTLNMLLYVPLGFFAALAANTARARALTIGIAAVAPIAFELLQRTPFVGRSCDIVDVVDNWLGIAVGVALAGTVAGAPVIARRMRGRSRG